MSLIDKVALIIDSKSKLEDLTYLPNKVAYDDNISILDINLESIIPDPPKNTSAKTKRELMEISKATKTRTKKEIDLVHMVDKEPLNLFYNFLENHGMKFPRYEFESYYNVLEQYVYALKYYYNRARPEQVAPFYNIDIDVIYTETHHTASYPSGHTMYAELAAHICSNKYPKFRKRFFELSNYCALARILQGVHYPSDNSASRIAVSKLYPLIRTKYEEKDKDFPLDIKS